MKRLLLTFSLACALAAGAAALAPASAQEPPASAPGSRAAATPVRYPQIPYKTAESETGAAAGESIVVLAVLLGLAWGGLVLAKRYLPQLRLTLPLPLKPNAARRLKVLETLRLGPRASLYLVQVDQKTLLLAQSGDNITVADAQTGSGRAENKDNDVAKHF